MMLRRKRDEGCHKESSDTGIEELNSEAEDDHDIMEYTRVVKKIPSGERMGRENPDETVMACSEL